MTKSSAISGFYKLSPEERLQKVVEFADLTEEDADMLRTNGSLGMDQADRMIENVIGTHELPVGVAMNFLINGKEYIIPMSVEEPSIVAAASNMARLARKTGGFETSTTDPVMIGQVQVTGVSDPFGAKMSILRHKEAILELANEQDPMLVKFGGGARDIEVRVVDGGEETFVVMHLLVDCRDAMGANAVNTMAEAVAPKVEEITGGKVFLRIISNLAIYRLARARVLVKKDDLGGEPVVDAVVSAYRFADSDPFRAATHNKGIMNGIDPVVVATGNDWRAIEAGAHAFASMRGHYRLLTHWEKNADGDLVGSIELPVAVGLVGGATKVHPTAKVAVKILGVKTASELGEILAAVGLAQNLGAMKALATEGIRRGHMSLHARNIAVQAGAPPELVDEVVKRLVAGGKVRQDIAEEILKELQG